MIPKRDEKLAQRLVLEAIESALREMREYLARELAAGREPNRRMLVAMSTGLDQIAREYSLDLASGPYGDLIEKALKQATADAAKAGAVPLGAPGFTGFGGIVSHVSRSDVETALYSSGLKVKGILDAGQRVVAEEMVAAIVGGKSQRDVVESLSQRLQVADEAGDLGEIPRWRAELIARNELRANYRQQSMAIYRESGFTHYEMIGPDDDRTNNDMCVRHLGDIHSEEEWEQIGLDEGIDPSYPLLTWGFHVNCRHSWVGMDEDTFQQRTIKKQREKQQQAGGAEALP